MEKNKIINEKLTERNTVVADKIAQQMGATNAADFVRNTADNINGADIAAKVRGKRAAAEFTADLLLLCLMQEIESPLLDSYVSELANKFDDGYIKEGNGKEYIVDLFTGSEEFVITDFNPTSITSPSTFSKYIAMYKKDSSGNVVPTPQSYKYKKPLTIQEHMWFPYFTSGNLRTFIENIVNKMVKSYTLWKYNQLATLITTIPISKTITGTATDLFKALSTEVFPEINNMSLLNQTYSIDATKQLVQTCPFEDMLMFIPNKVKNGLMHGIQSQLFNAHLMDINNQIPSSNLIVLGDKITYPDTDANSLVQVQDGTPYQSDTSIIVIDKKAIRHLQQIDLSGSQSYNNNLTIQMTLHVWGVIDYLPWYKAFKYTNPNLTKLPE